MATIGISQRTGILIPSDQSFIPLQNEKPINLLPKAH
jgi:hypothetical protein